jgi:hypothetical protein
MSSRHARRVLTVDETPVTQDLHDVQHHVDSCEIGQGSVILGIELDGCRRKFEGSSNSGDSNTLGRRASDHIVRTERFGTQHGCIHNFDACQRMHPRNDVDRLCRMPSDWSRAMMGYALLACCPSYQTSTQLAASEFVSTFLRPDA